MKNSSTYLFTHFKNPLGDFLPAYLSSTLS